MVKLISAEEAYPLRSLVLRNGASFEHCRFEGDHLDSTFHMGYLDSNGVTISILTCLLDAMDGQTGVGYRLRGMATHPDWQGKGVGAMLVRAAIARLTDELGADYLWCHARKVAYGFYASLGFDFRSPEFEVPGIGPHRVMYLNLWA